MSDTTQRVPRKLFESILSGATTQTFFNVGKAVTVGKRLLIEEYDLNRKELTGRNLYVRVTDVGVAVGSGTLAGGRSKAVQTTLVTFELVGEVGA